MRYKVKLLETYKKYYQKNSKNMDLLGKLQRILPRSFLLTRYKTLIGRRLDYADVIDGQTYNSVFQCKLEYIQHNAWW